VQLLPEWRTPNPVAQPDLSASVSSLAIHHHVCQATLATPAAQQVATEGGGGEEAEIAAMVDHVCTAS